MVRIQHLGCVETEGRRSGSSRPTAQPFILSQRRTVGPLGREVIGGAAKRYQGVALRWASVWAFGPMSACFSLESARTLPVHALTTPPVGARTGESPAAAAELLARARCFGAPAQDLIAKEQRTLSHTCFIEPVPPSDQPLPDGKLLWSGQGRSVPCSRPRTHRTRESPGLLPL